jgi:hypothetical protein
MTKKYKIQYKDKWYEVGDTLSIKVKLLFWPWLVSRQCEIFSIHEDGIATYKRVLGNKPKESFEGNVEYNIEYTPEEKRLALLKDNIGKRIVLYKVKTTQITTVRHPIFGYTNDLASVRYVSYYEEYPHEEVTSSETIEGILIDANLTMVKVDNNWYAFGYGPEKIYELNVIKDS